ncbi:MAG: glucokinase [Methylovulum sp.]|nr:glucokinase [Methylovulum sp.]
MRLAGDIGGTKTVLCLFEEISTGELLIHSEQSFSSRDYPQFNDVLNAFLPKDILLTSMCLGVAGPVVKQCCQTTNLPWLIDANALQQHFGLAQCQLLNDLEAMALGMLSLPEDELVELNPNALEQSGNKAVIAAGTGLGEALLYWDGERYHAMATEGGHCDLAAQTHQQDLLVQYLRNVHPEHVSYERVIAGDGFSLLYEFLLAHDYAPPMHALPDASDADTQLDRNAQISALGVAGEDSVCAEVVRLFVELYGAEAGNLALKALAVGGIYIGGGIAGKILSAMQEGTFLQAFKAKGRFKSLLDTVSVKIALNPRTPLLGAMHYFLN